MKSFAEPVRKWFGYSRRERRASFILLMIIVFVISVRFFVPEKTLDIRNIPVETDTIESKPALAGKINPYREDGHGYQKKKRYVVDINNCDTTELIRLPGIGSVLSARIIKYRKLLGGFARKEQIMEVYGLSPETYDNIKEMLVVDTMLITKIEINSADFRRLDRMPYLSRDEINAILKYRELEGPIRNIDELINGRALSAETAIKVRPYLKFD
jgi:DNA uptake protein ComE-like DNA-binding protein